MCDLSIDRRRARWTDDGPTSAEGEAVKFLFLICVDPTIPPDEGPTEIDDWVDSIASERRDGGPLQSRRTATTVRVRGGKVSATDGPFAETHEAIAGFDLIDCASRDEAIAIATRHPVARFGAIEVRQIIEG
jgi:hypothetical protein